MPAGAGGGAPSWGQPLLDLVLHRGRLGELAERLAAAEAGLRQGESLVRSIIDTAGSIIVCLDGEGRVVEWNAEAERAHGAARAEVLGLDYVARFIPPKLHDTARARLGEVLSGQAIPGFETEWRLGDGLRHVLLWNLTPLLDADGRVSGLLGIGHDITEQKRATESALALAAMAHALALRLDPAAALEGVAGSLAGLLRARRAAVYERDAASGTLTCVAVGGDERPERWIGRRLAPGEGLSGLAIAGGRPVATADALADERLAVPGWLAEGLARDDTRAAAAAPMTAHGETVGVVLVADCTGREFTPADLHLLASAADHAAIALHNARLHTASRRALARTTALLEATRALGETLDLAETLRRLACEVGRAVGADMVGAYLADADGSVLRPLAGYHVPAPLISDFREMPVPVRGHPFIEEAWRKRQPVWIADTRSDPRPDRRFAEAFPRASILAVPMPGSEEPIGALFCVWWQEHPRPTDDDIALVEAIAAQGAIAVRHARLHAAALALAPPPPG